MVHPMNLSLFIVSYELRKQRSRRSSFKSRVIKVVSGGRYTVRTKRDGSDIW